MPVPYSFTCDCCGKTYNEMPLCFGSKYPEYYFSIPEDEREQRVELAESLCVIDEHFFHRGRITIPIDDHDEDLVFNVWTTISQQNFELRNDLWNDPERVNQPPYFGWLQTAVPTYGNTLSLKTRAFENEVGLIPTIEVIEEGHPLRHDQQNGISFKTAVEKVQMILKEWHKES
ncbi:DUF2199 domain-containing protein [uncultured Mucilaginibacter sp.]|uniref:DUF2199 domain-containing protein n=1 Tax=uncultured Mucilaginibacter sp. TaxID=797541 RepID=UPI0025E7EED1|nr:DUF2199 domain-containing protein [uncultured Mucilaginibacter sp.]